MTADVVVYDGDCGICEWSATWIKKHVSSVDVVSHREYGVSYLPSVWFITWSGRYEGAKAVSEILKRTNSQPLQLFGSFLALPVVRTIASVVYFVIAKNRRTISRLFGLRACSLPGK